MHWVNMITTGAISQRRNGKTRLGPDNWEFEDEEVCISYKESHQDAFLFHIIWKPISDMLDHVFDVLMGKLSQN